MVGLGATTTAGVIDTLRPYVMTLVFVAGCLCVVFHEIIRRKASAPPPVPTAAQRRALRRTVILLKLLEAR